MKNWSDILPLSVLGLSLTACGGGGSSSADTPVSVIPTPVLVSDVEYAQSATLAGNKRLSLDIYQADNRCDDNRPTVLFVHGGGFVGGNKSNDTIIALADAANDKGLNFVSIQYRLLGDAPVLSAPFQAIADEFIALAPLADRFLVTAAVAATEDTVTALNWMADNENTYCLDTSNLAFWGSSAGAITVLQVGYGLNQYGITRPEPKVVIDYWGDLFRDNDLEFREAPFFILHGDRDSVVPYQGALDLEARAEAVGVPYAFYTVEDAGHAFGAIDIFRLQSNGVTILDHTIDFIEAHLIGGLPDYTTVTITP